MRGGGDGGFNIQGLSEEVSLPLSGHGDGIVPRQQPHDSVERHPTTFRDGFYSTYLCRVHAQDGVAQACHRLRRIHDRCDYTAGQRHAGELRQAAQAAEQRAFLFGIQANGDDFARRGETTLFRQGEHRLPDNTQRVQHLVYGRGRGFYPSRRHQQGDDRQRPLCSEGTGCLFQPAAGLCGLGGGEECGHSRTGGRHTAVYTGCRPDTGCFGGQQHAGNYWP